MSSGILIVEYPQSSLGYGGELCAFPSFEENQRRISWDSFAPEELGEQDVRLLIVNAVQGCEKARQFFLSLHDNPVSVPIFAVLPAEDPALSLAASEIVDDFLFWPIRPEELSRRIVRLLGQKSHELADIQKALTTEIGVGRLVGQDPAFLKVLEQLAQFGSHEAQVLLTGETGTGKELCARVIHLVSRRQRGPFIPVDCGALPDHLFENEVFGHTRGAFTDARSDQKGLVALAQHGTLFLDEIDSLSGTAQSKVLRLLQEHTYRPLGAEGFQQADVRIIAATNRRLEELVEQKNFRSDLFFRINVLRIHLPALRERRSDIALLSKYFIEDICKAANIPKKVLSQAAAHKLEHYHWPGNIRELYNTMQRSVLCSPGAQIAASMIDLNSSSVGRESDGYPAPGGSFRSAKQRAIASFERDYVRRMMDKHAGNVTQAAREAGKDRRAFGRLAKKYDVRRASA